MNTIRLNSVRLLSAYTVLILSLGCAHADPSNLAISFIGEFSNVRQTSEHAYGYSVQLWRSGDETVGFLSSFNGLSGDTPIGQLQNIHFAPSTGSLSFTAKLSVASLYLQNGKTQPTHDLFTFRGTLQNGKILMGSLSHSDSLESDHRPTVEQVRLVKVQRPPDIEADTFAGWQQAANRILKFRGPKW